MAPSQVPIMRPPFRTNFMLLVPEALLKHISIVLRSPTLDATYSVPAVEMCSLRSEAGIIISALLTL